MSPNLTTRGDTIYFDHEPDEIPPLPEPAPQSEATPYSAQRYRDFDREPPKLSEGRDVDDVDDYYGQFYCPICLLWRPSGESRAVSECGHVLCAGCWDDWAQTCGTGPANNRLMTCPLCRVQVRHSAVREVDFHASRFGSSTTVVQRLTNRISELKEENKQLRGTLEELREGIALLEAQRNKLLEHQAKIRALEEGIQTATEGVQSMVVDD